MAGAMKWTWEENKAFELALVEVPDSPAKLEIIAAQMRKPVEEIRYHYGKLVQDVAIIESGGVVVPEYSPRSASPIVPKKWTWEENKAFEVALVEVQDSPAKLEIIAAQMRRPVEEIKYHYDKLVQDVAIIESGGVVVPEYSPRSATPIVPKKWTWEENKAFEVALVEVQDSPAKLEIIAAQMRKPVEEIKYHYDKLVQDIAIIESGGVVVPEYSPRSATPILPKKGTRWSAQEHELFLEGLKVNGRGAWKAISRDFVKTRSQNQVKWHGQNYFKKQKVEAETKEGKGSESGDLKKTD